jgi:hypothetical protein
MIRGRFVDTLGGNPIHVASAFARGAGDTDRSRLANVDHTQLIQRVIQYARPRV